MHLLILKVLGIAVILTGLYVRDLSYVLMGIAFTILVTVLWASEQVIKLLKLRISILERLAEAYEERHRLMNHPQGEKHEPHTAGHGS